METIIPLPFLPSVNVTKDGSIAPEGLTVKQLSYLGCVYLTATNENVEPLVRFLQDNATLDAYVDAADVTAIEDITNILDAGARKVWLKEEHEKALEQHEGRVFRSPSGENEVAPDGLLVDLGKDASSFKNTLEKLKERKTSPVFLTSTDEDVESFAHLATSFGFIPIIPATKITFEKPSKGIVSVSGLMSQTWNTDRSGHLLPTVVTDERGIALGLVYSSQESLAESLKTGTGVYQSRKRGLWYKGATSGDTQELVRIYLDCDQDCLKFVVKQKGRGMWITNICEL